MTRRRHRTSFITLTQVVTLCEPEQPIGGGELLGMTQDEGGADKLMEPAPQLVKVSFVGKAVNWIKGLFV
jgi:hypothetical protein